MVLVQLNWDDNLELVGDIIISVHVTAGARCFTAGQFTATSFTFNIQKSYIPHSMLIICFNILQAPLICPIVLIAFSIFLFLGPIVGDPQWGHFVGVIVLITATLLWIMMVKFRLHLPMGRYF